MEKKKYFWVSIGGSLSYEGEDCVQKIFLLTLLVLLLVLGCTNYKTANDKNKGLAISDYVYGIGSTNDSDPFDEQKLQYKIILSNLQNVSLNKESIEILLTDWIIEKQTDNKITEVDVNNEEIVIKGYVIFGTKGLTKEEIISHEPFIHGVQVSTDVNTEVLNIKY